MVELNFGRGSDVDEFRNRYIRSSSAAKENDPNA
jgi:hypothetical protein